MNRQELKNFLRPYYRFLTRTVRAVQRVLPPTWSCLLQNILMLVTFSPSRYRYDREKQIFIVAHGDHYRYFKNMERGFSIYSRGIDKRGRQLFEFYCLQNIVFGRDDVIVDCGANYGDLFLELSQWVAAENYISFEPGPDEFACLVRNVPNGCHENLGLSETSGRRPFYLHSAAADSSLIKPRTYTNTIEVNVTTLDDYWASAPFKKCKLLKLEAEGFEPEILAGASAFLKICDYVAIDGGPERGESMEQTFTEITNILITSGYRIIDVHFAARTGGSVKALFQNIGNSR